MLRSGDGMGSTAGERPDWNVDANELPRSVGGQQCQDAQPKLVWFARSEKPLAVAAYWLL
jgi:hypothetical protein